MGMVFSVCDWRYGQRQGETQMALKIGKDGTPFEAIADELEMLEPRAYRAFWARHEIRCAVCDLRVAHCFPHSGCGSYTEGIGFQRAELKVFRA
jgi:hypothetical protein